MSAHFDFTVDTGPMANEIDGVSRHVAGTSAAVVAMQAAVVGAEKQAANRICENVNRGFYTLMHSQISQKIAKLQSDVDSFLMVMTMQTEQLLDIKNVMEHDYRMISTRYTKLFNTLNQSLKQQIFNIDKLVISFAVKELGKITNRPLNLTATTPFMQMESLSVSQKLLSSHIKNRSAKMLDFIHKFLMDSQKQKEITDNVLENKKVELERVLMNIPAVICESTVDSIESRNISVSVPQEHLTGVAKSEIKNAVFSQVSNIKWKDEQINDEIKSEFIKLNSNSSSPERVKKLAMELFDKNKFQISCGVAQ